MSGVFHQNLSQLRKNKRVSQRAVAGELFISQALLSHYENGIREPGLDFVNRACTYYGVTADALLGRTEADVAESLDTADADVPMDVRALVSLLQAVNKLEDDALFHSVLRSFGAVAYRLLRHMASADPDTAALFLTVPENRMAALAETELCRAEMQFLDCLERLAEHEDAPKRLISQPMEALLLALDKQIAQNAL